jgi:hypothetical protein
LSGKTNFYLVLVLVIDVFRVADHTNVTKVRPVYFVVRGFDGRLVDHGHDGDGEVNLQAINDSHAETAKYRKYDTPFYEATHFT